MDLTEEGETYFASACIRYTIYHLVYAIEFESLNTVKTIYENMYPFDKWWDERVLDAACRYSKLDVLEFLISRGCTLSRVVFRTAVYVGDLDIVKCLHKHRCPEYHAYMSACTLGHTDIVNFLQEKGYDKDYSEIESSCEEEEEEKEAFEED